MMIKNFISRFSKILFGVFLIGITLSLDTPQMGNAVLLSLIAVPFVFAGLFNWMPLNWLARKLTDNIKPLADYIKPSMRGV